jgi:hypothetical protein
MRTQDDLLPRRIDASWLERLPSTISDVGYRGSVEVVVPTMAVPFFSSAEQRWKAGG